MRGLIPDGMAKATAARAIAIQFAVACGGQALYRKSSAAPSIVRAASTAQFDVMTALNCAVFAAVS